MHHTVRFRVAESALETLEALAGETEQVGMEIRDHSLKPLPGAEPLPDGMADLVAWYEDEETARDSAEWLKGEVPEIGQVWFETVEDQDWTENWKKDVKATRAGRLWVGPSWLTGEKPAECVGIVIDPGMAFGTGDHPTTAMCMEAIDDWMAEGHAGCSVLDVGTGSGVLAMAARKLGSGEAIANDIDPQAVEIARENAANNGVDGVDWTTKPLERIRGSFDLVLANIFANVLCHYAARLSDATAEKGRLMLTGILNEQVDEVLSAFQREGMKLVRRRDRGEWSLLEMGH